MVLVVLLAFCDSGGGSRGEVAGPPRHPADNKSPETLSVVFGSMFGPV